MSLATGIGPALAVLSLTLFCLLTVPGQSSLFNVPTTDVVGKGRFYIEADYDAHIARLRNGGWHCFGVSAVYGSSKKTEVGLNAYLSRTADGIDPVEIQPNAKFVLYENETSGTAVSTGAIAYLPLKKRIVREGLVSAYVVASKTFDGNYAPRVTGGAYQIFGNMTGAGSSRGFLAAVEQPVHDRVTLVADWSTGKNFLGYSSAGVEIKLTKRSWLSAAYYFGNEGRGNNSIGIYYGFYF